MDESSFSGDDEGERSTLGQRAVKLLRLNDAIRTGLVATDLGYAALTAIDDAIELVERLDSVSEEVATNYEIDRQQHRIVPFLVDRPGFEAEMRLESCAVWSLFLRRRGGEWSKWGFLGYHDDNIREVLGRAVKLAQQTVNAGNPKE